MTVKEVMELLSRIDKTAEVITVDPETGKRSVVTRVYWTIHGVVVK